MQQILIKYIHSFGDDALFDVVKLEEFLLQRKTDPKLVYQLILILSNSSIKSFCLKSEKNLNSVEINNIIINTIQATGLSKSSVQNILSILFSALGYNFEYVSMFIPEEDEIIAKDEAFVTSRNIKDELYEARISMRKEKVDGILIYSRLAKAGSAEAMYQLAMCYMNGTGTAQDNEKAMKYLSAAAKNNHPQARAKLGDIYYSNPNITKRNFAMAYELYSGAGVLTADKTVKEKIVNILNQKKTNLIVLILGAILTVCMWLFLFINPQSVHHSSTLIGWGIPLTIIPTLFFGFACFLYKRLKYNNLKIFITAMMVIWAIYPLILAIN